MLLKCRLVHQTDYIPLIAHGTCRAINQGLVVIVSLSLIVAPLPPTLFGSRRPPLSPPWAHPSLTRRPMVGVTIGGWESLGKDPESEILANTAAPSISAVKGSLLLPLTMLDSRHSLWIML